MMRALLILCCFIYVNAGGGGGGGGGEDDIPDVPEEPIEPTPMEPMEPKKPMKRRFIYLPSAKHVLDVGTFRRQVEGERFSSIYSIIDSSDEMPTMRFRSRTRYFLSNTQELTFDSIFRSSPTDECDEEVGTHVGTLVGRRKYLALNTERSTDSGPTVPGRTYFMSRWPEQYLIRVTCDHRGGEICKRDFMVEVLVKQDPPNTVHWYEIEKELRQVLGLKLADKRNTFLYLGAECEVED